MVDESFVNEEDSVDASDSSTYMHDGAAGSSREAELTRNDAAYQHVQVPTVDSLQTRPVETSDTVNDDLDFSNIHLICPIDCQRIQTRWLEGFAPAPDRKAKNLSPGMAFFILTAMRSYPHMLTRPNALPPFIHAKQLRGGCLPAQLARCTTVAHMWANQANGSEDLVCEIIHKETQGLYDWIVRQESHDSESDMARLAALQAYLLYCLMLLPKETAAPATISQQTKINLQDLTSRAAATGVMTPDEETARPTSWAAWILAEAKRRTLYAVYMFDDIVNTLNGLPCVLGDELGVLPMTSSKQLWNAGEKAQWEREYVLQLGKGRGLRLEELWMHPAGEETRARRERWLSSVDEYGMMIYSIASITQLQ